MMHQPRSQALSHLRLPSTTRGGGRVRAKERKPGNDVDDTRVFKHGRVNPC